MNQTNQLQRESQDYELFIYLIWSNKVLQIRQKDCKARNCFNETMEYKYKIDL